MSDRKKTTKKTSVTILVCALVCLTILGTAYGNDIQEDYTEETALDAFYALEERPEEAPAIVPDQSFPDEFVPEPSASDAEDLSAQNIEPEGYVPETPEETLPTADDQSLDTDPGYEDPLPEDPAADLTEDQTTPTVPEQTPEDIPVPETQTPEQTEPDTKPETETEMQEEPVTKEPSSPVLITVIDMEEPEEEPQTEEIWTIPAEEMINADAVKDAYAIANADGTISLYWTYSPEEYTSRPHYQYIIYRFETEHGDYARIGYTQKNVFTYIDAGGSIYQNGAGVLEPGHTYYYKVQAYNGETNASSSLEYANTAFAIATDRTLQENEFIMTANEEAAEDYIKERMIERDTSFDIVIWCESGLENRYRRNLLYGALREEEDIMDLYGGDYLWYHLRDPGADAKVTDDQMIYDGLRRYTIHYTVYYYTTKAQETAVSQTLDNAIYSLGLNNVQDTAEKIRRAYEWMISGASYDTSLNNGLPRCSAYDAVVNKRADSSGYATAFYLFMKKLGVPCRIISGTICYNGETIPHTWNLVSINGTWYNVCVTTEIYMSGTYTGTEYRYLLKGDDAESFTALSLARSSDGARGIYYGDAGFRNTHPVRGSYYEDVVLQTSSAQPSAYSLTAQPAGDKIYLKWSYTPEEGRDIKNYRYLIYRTDSGQTADSSDMENCEIACTDKNVFEYIDSDALDPDTVYYYKIQAYDPTTGRFSSFGLSGCASAVVSKDAPLTLAGAEPKTENSITLTWDANPDAGSYEVWYRKDSADAFTRLSKISAQKTSMVHGNLTPSTGYEYLILAKDAEGGLLSTSETVSITTGNTDAE